MRDDFCHCLPVDRIGNSQRIDLVADEAERDAIAKRLRLQSLGRLEAHVTMSLDGPRIHAEGRIRAALEQGCIASGEPVAEHVDEAFELDFVPEPDSAADAEIELAEQDCDVAFYDGASIDLGTAIADTLALAMNPYPRSADAEAALKQAGVLSEAEAGPFAALAKLRKGADEA